MNTKDFFRLVRLRRATAGQGVPLEQVTDFVAQFILGGGATGARTSARFTVRGGAHRFDVSP